MRANVLWVATACCTVAMLEAQQPLPFEPPHIAGQSITGAFEGWFGNPDGSFSILLGYYNRNLGQALDIPVGPHNRIEPGGPDRGQPTHFLPGRQWGVFTITVPKDFGDEKLRWTITANGQTTVIPMSLNPLWEVSPLLDATGNAPPFIGFSEHGPFLQGPRGGTVELETALSHPLALSVWVADDAKPPFSISKPNLPPVMLSWSKYRGPGPVTFSAVVPPVEACSYDAPAHTAFSGRSATTAIFSEPGEYVLRVLANDWSGDGGRGFQCCWSNAQVKVRVTGGK